MLQLTMRFGRRLGASVAKRGLCHAPHKPRKPRLARSSRLRRVSLRGMGLECPSPTSGAPILGKLVRSKRVVLFMKGNRHFPACGFSATVVGILNSLPSEYETVNILEDQAIRDGMKEFSGWPTFPQLYVDGQFIGGCDIVKEMHAQGELQKLLGAEAKPVQAPCVTISPAAARALKEALSDAGEDVLRLEIDPQFNCDLHVSPRQDGDIAVPSGDVVLHVARPSASRADGIAIEFVMKAEAARSRSTTRMHHLA